MSTVAPAQPNPPDPPDSWPDPAQPTPAAPPAAPQRDLAGLLMQRAAWVGVFVLLGSTALGLLAMARDMNDEADAAIALAAKLAQVSALAAAAGEPPDAATLAALQALAQGPRTGHLTLHVQARDGRLLMPPPQAREPSAPLQWLLAGHRQLTGKQAPQSVQWTLQQPAAAPWTLTLTAAPEAEREEALQGLLTMLGLMLAGVVGLLAVMSLNLRRALAPLGRLLQAIERVEQRVEHRFEQRDDQPAAALPPMPVRELEAIARAVGKLSAALQAAEAQRRVLGQRVITLQEDERARLGRELHDEFGQHLTALRADTAWLARPACAQGEAAEVLEAVQQHVRHIQQVLRGVLARLRPLAPGGALLATDAPDEPYTLQRLAQLLQTLAAGWHQRAGSDLQVQLCLSTLAVATDGRLQRLPWPAAAGQLALPQALALAVYRITQEALTNVARHSGATRALVSLGWQAGHGLLWTVEDDGVGLGDASDARDALMRGSGLGGIKERIWALGADLQCTAAQAGRPRPGLRLQALLPWTSSGAQPDAASPDTPAGATGRGPQTTLPAAPDPRQR